MRNRMIFIIGPCAIESEEQVMAHAKVVAAIRDRLVETGAQIVFKAAYNKANRSDVKSFHGVGLAEGKRLLQKVKDIYGLRVTSDVHSEHEISVMKDVLDLIQIPQTLSRYTNILQAAGRTGKPISLKKGIGMDAGGALLAVDKIKATGNTHPVLLMDRGTSFGHKDLVLDMRNFTKMSRGDVITCVDGTHAALGRAFAPQLILGAVAAGAQAVFAECHITPDDALCDGKCMLDITNVESVIRQALEIRKMVQDNDEQ